MRPWRRLTIWPMLLGSAVLLIAGCTRPDLVDDDAERPTDLRWRPADAVVICDGTDRKAGTVEQAEAGEAIDFTTALPIVVEPGRADDAGNYALTWSCQPEEAQLRWDLTAIGGRSDREVRLTIVGAPVPIEERPLDVSVIEDTVECDGLRHEAGIIDGLSPGETVRFEADQDGVSAQPKSAQDGTLAFGWRCRPADVGRTWDVTVTAVDSDRTATFQLGGTPSTVDLPLELEAPLTEVSCDGQIVPLATLINLFPFEDVGFTSSPPASDLRGGSADGEGRLPLQWQCTRADVGTTWDLTAEAAETGKTIDHRFVGIAGAPIEALTVRLAEDPFVCDGERRVVAELSNLDVGEFVDFTSPQAGPLREGQADGGELAVNWQCTADELGGADTKVWALTATGRASGRSVTFDIVGVVAP